MIPISFSSSQSLFQQLKDYSASEAAPLHMPGHKRNPSGIPFLEELGARYDITEISGFDDLHAPSGILAEAMDKAASLWGSGASFFLVNGSTCGVLAAVSACARLLGNGKLIMARNCHRSVYHAAELMRLSPIYLTSPTVDGFGFCGSIEPKQVELAVTENPGTPVILTSPSYEGVMSNVAEIAVICHMYGSPLIVDEAHGAHLGLFPQFPGGAVRAGADVVIQSLHKSLTGLTQTGLLHVSGGLVSPELLRRELAVFETSSPSYLLMASIDGTRVLLEERGHELFRAWAQRLDGFDRQISIMQNLRLPGHGDLFSCQERPEGAGYVSKGIDSPAVHGYDRSKILISCEGTDTTGVALMQELRRRFNIECEMAACGYVVAMTGILDKNETLQRLGAALLELDGEVRKTAPRAPFQAAKLPPARMTVAEARLRSSKVLALRDAKGRVSAEYIWAYPPGIPLVVPGEELNDEIIKSLVIQRDAGVSLHSTHEGMPKFVRVLG